MGLMDLYFNPTGRINRSTYWLKGVLLLNAIWFVIWAVFLYLLLGDLELDDLLDIGYLLELVTQFAIFFLLFYAIYWWNGFSVVVKRLHDRDKSAWWVVIWWAIALIGGAFTFGIASFVVAIWAFIELGCLEGTQGANRYGPSTNPLYRDIPYQGGPSVPGSQPGGRIKTCPYCAETIQYAAIRCRYCGSDLARQDSPALTKPCPHCGRTVGNTAVTCGHCGLHIGPGTPVHPQPPVVQEQPAPRPAISPGRPVASGSDATVVQQQSASRPPASPGMATASGSDATVVQGQPAPRPAAPSGRPAASGSDETVVQQQPASRPAASPARPAASGSDATVVQGQLASRPAAPPGRPMASGSDATVVTRPDGPLATPPGGTPGSPVPTPASDPSQTMALQPNVASSMAWLVVTKGPSEGKSLQLKEGNNSIGRSLENDLQIDDGSVSRSHAMVNVSDGQFTLVDLGSTSGTRIGDRLISGKRIGAGSSIVIGRTRLHLVSVDAYQGGASSGATMVGSPTGSSLSLVAQSGPDAGKSFLLTSAQNMIGRDPSAQVTLSDPTVSSHHAVIRVDADRTSIADLGSQAGTQVDGESVQGSRISVGDRVVIGQSEFMLMRPSSP